MVNLFIGRTHFIVAMKATRVSVVTVVLNQADDFIKTATSIIEQDYHNLEWIVIDGGSVDGIVKGNHSKDWTGLHAGSVNQTKDPMMQ